MRNGLRPSTFAAVSATLTLAAALLAAGCGDGDEVSTVPAAATAEAAGVPDGLDSEGLDARASGGIRLVRPAEVAALVADGVTVVDVRTPQEYAEAHLDGATLIDFYEPDFASRIAELDRDGEYLVYCRSGNRSGQAVALMEQLGFADVADLDGGMLAYQAAGLDVAP